MEIKNDFSIPIEVVNHFMKKDRINLLADYVHLKLIYSEGSFKKNITQIGKDLGVTRSTVYSKLEQLEKRKLITYNEEEKRYRLKTKGELKWWYCVKTDIAYPINHLEYNLNIRDFLYLIFLVDKYNYIIQDGKMLTNQTICHLTNLQRTRTTLFLTAFLKQKIFTRKKLLIPTTDNKFKGTGSFFNKKTDSYCIGITVYNINDEIRKNIRYKRKEQTIG